MTHYIWHVTCCTWHVARDMWHAIHGSGYTFSKNFSSIALTDCERQCFEDMFIKDEWLNESVSEEGVCRTAPTTLGLLILYPNFGFQNKYKKGYSSAEVYRKLMYTFPQGCLGFTDALHCLQTSSKNSQVMINSIQESPLSWQPWDQVAWRD